MEAYTLTETKKVGYSDRMSPKTCSLLQTKAFTIRGRSSVDEIGRDLALIREGQTIKKIFTLVLKPGNTQASSCLSG
jgi:hypothetical protein